MRETVLVIITVVFGNLFMRRWKHFLIFLIDLCTLYIEYAQPKSSEHDIYRVRAENRELVSTSHLSSLHSSGVDE